MQYSSRNFEANPKDAWSGIKHQKKAFYFPQLPEEITSVKQENHVNVPVTYCLHGKVKDSATSYNTRKTSGQGKQDSEHVVSRGNISSRNSIT